MEAVGIVRRLRGLAPMACPSEGADGGQDVVARGHSERGGASAGIEGEPPVFLVGACAAIYLGIGE